MDSTKYFCQNCKKELKENQRTCPFCKSTKRDIHVEISDTINIRESLGIKKFIQGIKKFVVHVREGWFPSGDKKTSSRS
jgi:hypothetical protein